MRYLYFILVVTFLLNSCSKSDDVIPIPNFEDNEFPQEWKLAIMTIGMVPNSETYGQEMPMQETYIFNEDGSFTKNRITEEDSLTVEGTYKYQEEAETEEAIILEHDAVNTLIGNCSSSKKSEYLYFIKDDAYLRSNWHACDGPSLFYERVKVGQDLN